MRAWRWALRDSPVATVVAVGTALSVDRGAFRRFGRLRWAIEVLVVAVFYYGAARLGLQLAFEKTNATPVWPPSGIAVAAVLVLGYRVWPGILLGAFVANVVAFLANQAAGVFATVAISSVIATGNTLEAVVGRVLLTRWVGAHSPFTRAPDVFRFTAVAGLACLVSSSIGATAVGLAGLAPPAGYGTIWFTWWLGDAAGVLLVAPLLMTWSSQPRLGWGRGQRIEAALLFVSLLVGVYVGFGGWLPAPAAHNPLTFAPLPWLVWAAFRFGPREAATAAAVTSGIAVWNTVNGLGPFVRGTINESLLLLQAFVGVVTVTILTMAALVAERRSAEARLRKAHDALEARVAERTRALVQVNETLQAEVAERRRAEEIAEQRRRETEVLADLAHRISMSLDLDAVLQAVATSAHELAASDMAGVMLREGASEVLTPRYMTGHRAESGWMQLRVEPGKGIAGQVLTTGLPWRTDDYAADSRFSKDYLDYIQAEGIVAAILAPIPIDRPIEGLLYVANRTARAFGDDDEAVVARLAAHAATAIRNAQLFQEAARRRETAERLADVGRRISQSLDPRDVAQRVAESLRALLSVPVAVVYRLEPASGRLQAIGLTGDAGAGLDGDLSFPAGAGGAGLAVRERRVITSLNVLEDPQISLPPEIRPRVEGAGYRAILALPLVVQDTIVGAIGVGDRAGRRFTSEEIELVQAFAAQASIALENAHLYEQVRQSYDDLSRTQAQLLQAQKMDAVGQLAAGVAHDFNNMLAVIGGRAQLLKLRANLADRERRDLELIQSACERAAILTRQLLAFSRQQAFKPELVDLNQVVAGIRTLLNRLMKDRAELVVAAGADLGRVKADPGQLGQVLMNLAVNARDAMPEGGRLTLETANVDLDRPRPGQPVDVPPGRYVTLAARDTGCGMDPTTLTHIFEPFFTTKPVGEGTGLGLSTVYGIVTQSGGHIHVESAPGKGTTFTVYLPQVEEAGPVPSPPSPEPRLGSETILLVDDDEAILEVAGEALRGWGYTVLEAGDGVDALRVAQQHPGPVHLLLTDLVMPRIDGPELAQRLAETRPDTRIVYMSAMFAHADLLSRAVLTPPGLFLEKPFNPEALRRKVSEALAVPKA
jgi:signal transduction histidine kinase/integral membrane sensor domain MASE1/CheY-like chemotaxis protein